MIARPIAQPLARALTDPRRGGAAALTPTQALVAALSAAAVRAVYNAQQTSLFQAISGPTTPVTAPTDPVGYWLDLSGAGNHLAASSTGTRGTYNENSNASWVRFEGASQGMAAIVPATVWDALHTTGGWIALVGELTAAGGGVQDVLATNLGGATDAGLRIRRVSTNNVANARIANGTAGNNVSGANNTFALNTRSLWITEYAPGGALLRQVTNKTTVSTAITITPGGNCTGLSVGSQAAANTLRVFGIAASSRTRDAELTAIIEAWAGERRGSPL